MNLFQHADCCGIAELCGITVGSADRIPQSLYSSQIGYSWNTGFPFIIFSDHQPGHPHGKALVALIKKHNLGPVHSTRTRSNPTGSLTLKMYTWQPNWDNIVKWRSEFRRGRRAR